MSMDWQIRCRDCGVVGGVMVQRQLDVVRSVVLVAPHLAAVLVPLDIRLVGADWIDSAFLVRHGTHRLVPHNEHGEDDGQCNKYATCDASKCRLDMDHEGPCEPGKRD